MRAALLLGKNFVAYIFLNIKSDPMVSMQSYMNRTRKPFTQSLAIF